MDWTKIKYKDELPINTINKVRGILGGMGLLTTETVWRNSVDGFYSVTVVIENTDLTTNGKGTSAEFALASAYGELMERVQNLTNYRLSLDMKPETMEYMGFYYAPDEKPVSLDALLMSDEGWIRAQLAMADKKLDNRALLGKWRDLSYEAVPADFMALPYCNLKTKEISHIPVKMVSKMYMSNGMCAGNTPEEAIVQGLSEVFERYANKKIVRDKVVPPTIPRKYLAKFPKIEAMLAGIEASGNFEVVVKDCSLGGKFPVVGVIYINKDDQSYFVKFGAHPKFEIAAERTLTELLQGQDVRRMIGVREFSYRSEADDPENFMSILVNGSGVYPTVFFSRNFSYNFSEFENPQLADNKEMLRYMVDLVASQGYETYVRDVSFLGFPSYHVIVPGLSEVEDFDDLRTIDEYTEYVNFKKLVRGVDKLTAEGAQKIIDYLEKMNYVKGSSVMDIINLPTKSKHFPWYYENADLFIIALYYWRSEAGKAYEAFDRFLHDMRPVITHRPVITYYKCVRDFLGAKAAGLGEKEITAILGNFYPTDVIRGVIGEFSLPQRIISYQGQLNCWNCDKCAFAKQCLYQPMEEVFKLLKEKYLASGIDQNNLKQLL